MTRLWGASRQAVSSWITVSRLVLKQFRIRARHLIVIRHDDCIGADLV